MLKRDGKKVSSEGGNEEWPSGMRTGSKAFYPSNPATLHPERDLLPMSIGRTQQTEQSGWQKETQSPPGKRD